MRKSYAAAGLVTAIAVPASLLVATPAHADAEREGRCGGATYELNVDRERGRFEVDADLDAAPGSTWRVVLRHEGKVFLNQVRTADGEGEIGIDRSRANTRGKDAFTMSVTKTGSPTTCSVRVVTR